MPNYLKYDKSLSNKNGRINRTTTSFKKHKTPITSISTQNVFAMARSNDGFSFLYSICHILFNALKKKKEIKTYLIKIKGLK